MTVNLTITGIPEFNPRTPYEHGDLFYIPELNDVYMEDKYGECKMPIYGEVTKICHGDVPQVTYNICSRGTGKGAIIAKCMPDGWNRIKKVIFNDPATIVFWQDGTKGESYDPEKGLMAAIAKKAFGNLGNYYNQIKKWLPEEEREETNPCILE